jgi:hypothetical protein
MQLTVFVFLFAAQISSVLPMFTPGIWNPDATTESFIRLSSWRTAHGFVHIER